MNKPALAALMLALASLAACRAEDTRFGPLKQRGFVLEGRAYTMQLPEKVVIQACRLGKGVLFAFKPGGRSPMEIVISDISTGQVPPAATDNRGSLRFTTSVAEGGSGGAEVTSTTTLTVAGRYLGVRCLYQDEWAGARDGEWCVRYLETLTPAPQPSAEPHAVPPPAEADPASRC